MKILTIFTFLIHSTMSEPDQRVITTLKYSTHRVKLTVVNGEPVDIDKVPYLVSIKDPVARHTADAYYWANLCGGTIIGIQKVLTAAHCFEGNNFFYADNPQTLRIFAGNASSNIIHSGATDTTKDVQVRRIERAILNKNFHFPSDDIAMVYVDVPWDFRTTVGYAIPAKTPLDYYDTCFTAGFGRIGHDQRDPDSGVLLAAPITVLSRWKCSELWEMDMNNFVCTDSVVSDVAQGDSGGPLVCLDTIDPAEMPGKHLLVGVVSGKNFDKTTLFTRVSAYSNWIDDPTNASSIFCYLTPTLLTIIALLLIYVLFLLHQINCRSRSFVANRINSCNFASMAKKDDYFM